MRVKDKTAKNLKSLTKMPFEQNARRIATRLKTDVNIKTSARGNGRITIKFKNEEELKRIEKILSE